MTTGTAAERRRLSKAETILQSYGIDHPSQIDLEAIAYGLGAEVRYRKLDGSEARIVGNADSAIITVNEDTKSPRQRFSIAHEIGHWVERHGKGGFVCAKEDIAPQNAKAKSAEAEANSFASQLILPSYLFDPMVVNMSITLDTADKLRTAFHASLTATTIKLVQGTKRRAAVICDGTGKREWFITSSGLPESLRVSSELHYETEAIELLYSQEKKGKTSIRQESATRWFSGWQARELKVRAQSVKLEEGKILSVIEIA